MQKSPILCKKGVVMGILSWILGKKEENFNVSISKNHLQALVNSLESRFLSIENRIAKVEGSYGVAIRELKREITDLEEENIELNKQVQESGDLESKRQKLMALAPQVLATSDFTDAQKAAVQQFLANPANIQQVDALLEQYFPDMPITTEGLIALLPVLKSALSMLPQQKKEEEEKQRLAVLSVGCNRVVVYGYRVLSEANCCAD